jgi:hypothetical protein
LNVTPGDEINNKIVWLDTKLIDAQYNIRVARIDIDDLSNKVNDISKNVNNFTEIFLIDGTFFGCALGMIISFCVNHSVLWAILHGLFGWFYVIYYCVTSES